MKASVSNLSSETSVHFMNYHFVWCPKYRKNVIVGIVEKRLKELLQEKARDMQCKILALETMSDHIHISVQATPLIAPDRIVAGFKGHSSRVLRQEFPHLVSGLPTLWTRSYFVSTHGHVSDAAIKKYIEPRKKKGSKNREKSKPSLAKAWRKIRTQRDDFAHKLSHKLAMENDLIVFEGLNINGMVKNHNLASAILDSTWAKFRQLTAYKAERRGGRVILVNPGGTSQKCSRCGKVAPKSLSERIHQRPRCGLTLDRDINAARNILKGGLEQSHAETEPLLVRRISKFQSRKREANEFTWVVHVKYDI